MTIHNTTEDAVFAAVDTILDNVAKKGNPEKYCLCEQCRQDTVCYVLNRVPPHYIVSNRGVARVEQDTFEKQQKEADIATLVYEGIRRVSHNQRPNFNHDGADSGTPALDTPVFNIPTIIGRVFNGLNFSPMAGIKVELRRDGALVSMKDNNWQNPYALVANTAGTFTFWPADVPAGKTDEHRTFEYAVHIEAEGMETLEHHFSLPVKSELQSMSSYSMNRSFKLPDLYLFPPGGEEDE